jgi:hypothetical protein
MAAAWGGMVLLDTTIFALTLYKSLKLERIGRRSVVYVLLRDGECPAYEREILPIC